MNFRPVQYELFWRPVQIEFFWRNILLISLSFLVTFVILYSTVKSIYGYLHSNYSLWPSRRHHKDKADVVDGQNPEKEDSILFQLNCIEQTVNTQKRSADRLFKRSGSDLTRIELELQKLKDDVELSKTRLRKLEASLNELMGNKQKTVWAMLEHETERSDVVEDAAAASLGEADTALERMENASTSESSCVEPQKMRGELEHENRFLTVMAEVSLNKGKEEDEAVAHEQIRAEAVVMHGAETHMRECAAANQNEQQISRLQQKVQKLHDRGYAWPQPAMELDSLDDQMQELCGLQGELNLAASDISLLRTDTEKLMLSPEVADRMKGKLTQLDTAVEEVAEMLGDLQSSVKLQHALVTEFESARAELWRRLGDEKTADETELEQLLINLERAAAAAAGAVSSSSSGLGCRHLDTEMERARREVTRRLAATVVSSDAATREQQRVELRRVLEAADAELTSSSADGKPSLQEQSLSTEYYAARAQLQDRRALLERLQQRRGSVEALNNKDKDDFSSEQLVARYREVEAHAAAEVERCERAVKLARAFKDHYEPALVWLDGAEKMLATMNEGILSASATDSTAIDPTELEKLVRQCQNVYESGNMLEHRKKLCLVRKKLSAESGVFGEVASDKAMLAHLDNVEQRICKFDAVYSDSIAALLRRVNRQSEHSGSVDLDNVARVRAAESRCHQWQNRLTGLRLDLSSQFITREALVALRTLMVDIDGHQAELQSLSDIGQQLSLSTESDNTSYANAVGFRNRVFELGRYYDEVREATKQKVAAFETAVPLAEKFLSQSGKLDLVLQSLSTRISQSVKQQELEIAEMEVDEVGKLIQETWRDLDSLRQLPELDAGIGDLEQTLTRTESRFRKMQNKVTKMAESADSNRNKAKEQQEILAKYLLELQQMKKRVELAESRLGADYSECGAVGAEFTEISMDMVRLQEPMRAAIESGRCLARHWPANQLCVLTDRVRAEMAAVSRGLDVGQTRVCQLQQLLTEFEAACTELNHALSELELRLRQQQQKQLNSSVGDEDLALLDHAKKELEALVTGLDDEKPTMDRLQKTGPPLARLLASQEQSSGVLAQVEDARHRYDNLRSAVRASALDIEDLLQIHGELNEKVDQCAAQLETVRDRVSLVMQTGSVHPEKLEEELTAIVEIGADIGKLRGYVDKLQRGLNNSPQSLTLPASATDEVDNHDNLTLLEKVRALFQTAEKLDELSERKKATVSQLLSSSHVFWVSAENLSNHIGSLERILCGNIPMNMTEETLKKTKQQAEEVIAELDSKTKTLGEIKKKGAELVAEVDNETETLDVDQAQEELERGLVNVKTQADAQLSSIEEQISLLGQIETLRSELDEWLQEKTERLDSLGPLPSETRPVLEQMELTKALKLSVEPRHRDRERLQQLSNKLNRHQQRRPELAAVRNRAVSVTGGLLQQQLGLTGISSRWERLLDGLGQRQHHLQCTLLNLGEFHRPADEFIQWVMRAEHTIVNIPVEHGDTAALELAIAQHKMIRADLNIQQVSLSSIERKAVEIMQHQTEESKRQQQQQTVMVSDLGHEAQQRLEELSRAWNCLKQNLRKKHFQLEDALRETLTFSADYQEILRELDDTSRRLDKFKFSGGLPDTAREHLQRFMELYDTAFPRISAKMSSMEEAARTMATQANPETRQSLEKDVASVQERWAAIRQQADARRSRLEKAMRAVENFHADMTAFIGWLTLTKRNLNLQRPPSRILDSVLGQIEAHNALKRDITSHKEQLQRLDSLASQLKYSSQKQDAVLIRNLMANIHHRWERAVCRSSERSRALTTALTEAQQWCDTLTELHDFMNDLAQRLDQLEATGNASGSLPSQQQERVRQQLQQHRTEVQAPLEAKLARIDAARRLGDRLSGRVDCAPQDRAILQEQLRQLHKEWQALCKRCFDRENALNDALLFCGSYKDALESLLKWLRDTEPRLSDTGAQSCRGDVTTVEKLQDEHNKLTRDVRSREAIVTKIQEDGHKLMAQAGDDRQMEEQLADLVALWNRVKEACDRRQADLNAAKTEAREFESEWSTLKGILVRTEAELCQILVKPDSGCGNEESQLQTVLAAHARFQEQLQTREASIRDFESRAHDLLANAHPDAASAVKSYNNIIKSEWTELINWLRQRGEQFQRQLKGVRARAALLEELLTWLGVAEGTLRAAESRDLPRQREEAQHQLTAHENFIEDITRRQKDHDEVLKHAPRCRLGLENLNEQTRETRHVDIRTTAKEKFTIGPSGSKQFENAQVGQMHTRWNQVWFMVLNRRQRLADHMAYLDQLDNMCSFSFEDWRRRYVGWMNQSKVRIMDFYRSQDKDCDGKITRKEFIEGILRSTFSTNQREMEIVANYFDKDNKGFIDHQQFKVALYPNRYLVTNRQINDEIDRCLQLCVCQPPYKVIQWDTNKYKFGTFGRTKMISPNNNMVRIGGGWCTIEEFIRSHDPCQSPNAKLMTPTVLRDNRSSSSLFSRRGSSEFSFGSNSTLSSSFSVPNDQIKSPFVPHNSECESNQINR